MAWRARARRECRRGSCRCNRMSRRRSARSLSFRVPWSDWSRCRLQIRHRRCPGERRRGAANAHRRRWSDRSSGRRASGPEGSEEFSVVGQAARVERGAAAHFDFEAGLPRASQNGMRRNCHGSLRTSWQTESNRVSDLTNVPSRSMQRGRSRDEGSAGSPAPAASATAEGVERSVVTGFSGTGPHCDMHLIWLAAGVRVSSN